MPCSFQDASQLSKVEQASLLQDFATNLKDRHRFMFSISSAHFQQRHNVIAAWQGFRKAEELYDAGRGWQQAWFAPSFWAAAQAEDPVAAFHTTAREVSPGVFAFDMFTPEFCDTLAAELEAFERSSLPKSRPNSMNKYGVILGEMGLEAMVQQLVTKFLQPLVDALMPDLTQGLVMDCHHCFAVQYQHGQDVHLDMHTDDSEFTVNVNLEDDFEGCGLTFCGTHGTEAHRKFRYVHTHQKGRAVAHAGLHRHGADPLQRGRRKNLIIWCRSSAYRQTGAFAERYRSPFLSEEPPDERCLSRTHDRDFSTWQEAFVNGSPEPGQLRLQDTNPGMPPL
jgi:hypothetical protein